MPKARTAGLRALGSRGLAAALVSAGIAGAAPPPALPGPAPRARGADVARDPARANEACASCHEDIAAEWRGSMHAAAWTDPVFQKALALEPLPFCRGCHAPEGDPARPARKEAAAVGVGCITCHLEEGAVVSAAPSGRAPHPVLADARRGTVAACSGCHQFDFPGPPGRPMQDTVGEHAASTTADIPCQSCHMRTTGARPHRSHAFRALSAPALVRSAARVSAERTADGAVTVRLAPAAAGHAFPTGDLFRRLEVRAFAVDDAGRVVARAPSISLQRLFENVAAPHGEKVRTQVDDTRVPPPGGAPREVTLVVPGAPAARIVWAVAYQRMATPMATAFGVSQVVDEIVVAEGELAPRALPSAARGGAEAKGESR